MATEGALLDLKVLDLTQYIAGPYATKLLADYGADVVKIERPGGDPARGLGPFKGGDSHPERSGTFFYFNTNKRSVVVDLKQPAGDHWIALTVWIDAQWLALRGEIGDPEWARIPGLEPAPGRASRQDLLDERVAEWTRGFDDYELMERLQRCGIAAMPVLEASRLLDDPQVRARELLYEPLRIFDDVGVYEYLRPFYRFSGVTRGPSKPPVAFGEDNEYVYKQVIGVDDEEYERLRAGGHIRMEFDESVP